MGRIKTTLVKRSSNAIFKMHKDELKDNFEENKGLIGKFLDVKSKKFRNVIAGYITRLVRKQDKL